MFDNIDSKVKIVELLDSKSSKNHIQNSTVQKESKDSFYNNVPYNEFCKQFNSGCSNKNLTTNECDLAINNPSNKDYNNHLVGTEYGLFSGYFSNQTQNQGLVSSTFENSIRSNKNGNSSYARNSTSESPYLNKVNLSNFIEVLKAPVVNNNVYSLNQFVTDVSRDVSKISFSDLVRSVSIPSLKPKKGIFN